MISASRTPGGKVRLKVPGFTTVVAAIDHDAYMFDLRPSDAEQLIKQLQSALEGHIVRVSPMNEPTGRAYTYRDPSGTLRVGDLVEVPFGVRNTALLGHVVGIGRNGYDGLVKDVTAKLAKTPLALEVSF